MKKHLEEDSKGSFYIYRQFLMPERWKSREVQFSLCIIFVFMFQDRHMNTVITALSETAHPAVIFSGDTAQVFRFRTKEYYLAIHLAFYWASLLH